MREMGDMGQSWMDRVDGTGMRGESFGSEFYHFRIFKEENEGNKEKVLKAKTARTAEKTRRRNRREFKIPNREFQIRILQKLTANEGIPDCLSAKPSYLYHIGDP